jgi:protein-tyrosine phosphatase/membrane-associated phospholipid phosphatase
LGNLQRFARTPRGQMIIWATAASVLLSLLFFIVYGGANWLTSQRHDVGTWYFAWEEAIPFVPLMVVPYMSIDLFFTAAPFLCGSRRELAVYYRRIVLAIVVAGICFLVLPLKLGYARPRLDGWMGTAFGWFFATDLPYNLCPSLHIALRTILAETYSRHTRGGWRIASNVWFSLVGASTLLTHQHHVIDVVGGFILGGLCFYLIPARRLSHELTPNRRIAANYLVGALASSAVAALLWPWGSILIWPTASCVVAATGYLRFGPAIYRKTAGRLPWSSRFLFAPLIAGHRLSILYYSRQCQAWDEVTPHVWIGRTLSNREAVDAARRGVSAVLDLTAELSEATTFLALRYLNVPILDLTGPTPDQLKRCLEFISKNAKQGVVYVHCKVGYSRSAAVVAAYLIASGAALSSEEAIAHVRSVRPAIVIRPEAIAAIRSFENDALTPSTASQAAHRLSSMCGSDITMAARPVSAA